MLKAETHPNKRQEQLVVAEVVVVAAEAVEAPREEDVNSWIFPKEYQNFHIFHSVFIRKHQ